jgi:sugar lactone lactonase YvrE
MAYDLEQITPPVAFHAEGPVWHNGWGGLRWVDMFAGDVLSLASSGEITRTHVGDLAAVVRPRADGGMVVGVERGFALVDPDGAIETLPDLWEAGPIRMNEGACDPDGRFYCGSYSPTPGTAALYRLDPDGSISTVLTGVTASNGLAWTADGATAYHVDRRVLVLVPSDVGKPDGLAVDAEGGIWVAIYGGASVHRYTPAGELDEVIAIPASHVTAVTFGGPDLHELFITTSRENLPEDAEPNAGSVYRARAGLAGMPTSTFAG